MQRKDKNAATKTRIVVVLVVYNRGSQSVPNFIFTVPCIVTLY